MQIPLDKETRKEFLKLKRITSKIDGSHKYEDVRKDFLVWEKFLVEGGIIAFHGTVINDGPRRVEKPYIIKSKRYSDIGFVDNITFARKTAAAGPSYVTWMLRELSLVLLWIRIPAFRN